MGTDLDLPSTLQRRFRKHHRELIRQLKSVTTEEAKTPKGSPEGKRSIAILKSRILCAERHKNSVLMVQRKGTFGKALCPVCPICLIDHDKTSLLDERGNRFKCTKCGLVVEAAS